MGMGMTVKTALTKGTAQDIFDFAYNAGEVLAPEIIHTLARTPGMLPTDMSSGAGRFLAQYVGAAPGSDPHPV